ncbi:YARHG domain-containing protein [Treponema bryantii]|uniref:YARHG domain-containing protein n=1 Tax=Treponema bryantii TaxID=163 RepID=A0A1H9D197_9SPIR|nr:YARHG domain-containing protein [Treponema bryantii]SEQ07147.1 YARHG domain-containing protein [Treponema bryantii]
MKKKLLLTATIFSMSLFCFAQEVERLFQTSEIKHHESLTSESPFGIYVDEVTDNIEIMNGNWDGGTRISLNGNHESETINDFTSFWASASIRLENKIISFSDSLITIQENKNIFVKIKNECANGISFILKKGNGYIVYYVDESGYPGAVDTTSRIYSSEEAMAYLKEYDPEKYRQSEKRAAELELYNDFICNRILIWGETYYTVKNDSYILNGLIQYDKNGYGYQLSFDYESTELCIVNPEGKRNMLIQIDNGYKHLLKNEYSGLSSSWYVGYGGNIYYYMAGEAYTEVFRIRRTWGDPDFYAMAINGYTDDSYGQYVNKILPTLSKAELRLLRNTIFAIYGVHFKSADLSAHFAKQVWYTDEGKTSGEITLPAHRQKLVEMIQKLEK